jgi:hypothetical protein
VVIQHPLGNEAAKRLIVQILKGGAITFSGHALDEMAKDGLTTTDAANVLRGGVVEFCEEIARSWRYRVRTSRMTFVIAFHSDRMLRVVTAWRHKK